MHAKSPQRSQVAVASASAFPGSAQSSNGFAGLLVDGGSLSRSHGRSLEHKPWRVKSINMAYESDATMLALLDTLPGGRYRSLGIGDTGSRPPYLPAKDHTHDYNFSRRDGAGAEPRGTRSYTLPQQTKVSDLIAQAVADFGSAAGSYSLVRPSHGDEPLDPQRPLVSYHLDPNEVLVLSAITGGA